MDRRRFLRLAGAGAAVTLAGCGGTDGPGNGTDNESDTGGNGTGSTDEPGSSGLTTPQNDVPDLGHAAAAGLDQQPVLGEWTGNVIVAFEDPSCPRCRAFHEQVYPQIKSNFIEQRKAAFVYRNYPVVYPWGKPASKAIEATFERDPVAGWGLIDHYYDQQSTLDTETVLPSTAEFLSANTAVDGSAVVTAVENGDADASVQVDLDAGQAAGFGGTTPTIAIFRDNEFQTDFAGSLSYDALATILGD